MIIHPAVKYTLVGIFVILLIILVYFFVGSAKPANKITWGVNFSVKQTDFLGLDSKETYLALLDELNFKNVKISVHWDELQPNSLYDYNFDDIDWQIREAEKRNVNVVLAIGMKTPRWPECHLPQWVRNQNKSEQQESITRMVTALVERYKGLKAITAWQVENEPFLNFGACPWYDKEFLKKEIKLVKDIDPSRPVIVTDSGEIGFWFEPASAGADIVGVTTYRRVWQDSLKFYFDYFFPPVYYQRRAELVNLVFKKHVIGTELQAEAWCPNSIINASLEEQEQTMSLEKFKDTVKFAKNTGIDTFYFWGGEWWYWLKKNHNRPEIWEEAKKLLSE
ncbi:cellulase family glycosylhydrolase [bacterium]|nr:cellulase family glycosylhydrolase [bacterium]